MNDIFAKRSRNASKLIQFTRIPKKSPISFGQNPKTPQASVVSQTRRNEVSFRFNAIDFDPSTPVQAKIQDSRGHDVKSFAPVNADQNGSIGYAKLQWKPESNLQPGTYTFVVTGKCRGKTVSVKEDFSLVC